MSDRDDPPTPTPRQTGSHAIMSTACADLVRDLETLARLRPAAAQAASDLVTATKTVRLFVDSWPSMGRPVSQDEKNKTWESIFGLRGAAQELAASYALPWPPPRLP